MKTTFLNFRHTLALPLCLLTLLLMGSCKKDNDNQASPDPDQDAKANVKLTTHPTLGAYLTDGSGKTLYMFAKDVNGTSACEGGCLTQWPIFYEENIKPASEPGGRVANTGLRPEDFGVLTRADGQKQSTFKGWPLYRFAPDGNPGEVKGEGATNNWFVAKPDYTVFVGEKDGSQFLLDMATGKTLYTFANDPANTSICTGGCATTWPPMITSSFVVPSTLKADFSVITRPDISIQLVYKQKPLYAYVQDTQKGDIKGATVPNWSLSSLTVSGPEPGQPETSNLKLATHPTFGSYFTDKDGRTLYFFTRDIAAGGACSGGCLNAWPIFYEDNLIVPAGMAPEYFGVITRGDGQKQNTYRGWPLYRYTSDAAPGAATGDGVGGNWFIAKPDYTVMIGEKDGKKYLTNRGGRTLFNFSLDGENDPNCTGDCIEYWPIFEYINSQPLDAVVPSILAKADFGTVASNYSNGTPQITYKKKPLYYYGQDAQRGATSGASIPNWTLITF